MYSLEVEEHTDRKFKKLARKDRVQLEIINKKVHEILEDPYKFKPLRAELHGTRAVHIDKSFVLVYEIDEKRKAVRVLDYDHHDRIYG